MFNLRRNLLAAALLFAVTPVLIPAQAPKAQASKPAAATAAAAAPLRVGEGALVDRVEVAIRHGAAASLKDIDPAAFTNDSGFKDHRLSPSFRLEIASIRAAPRSLADGPAKCHLKCHAVRHRSASRDRSARRRRAGRTVH